LKKKRYNAENNRNSENNKTTEGHKAVPRSLDAWIIEELLNDAYVSSTEISKKHRHHFPQFKEEGNIWKILS
jgi:hypothetical protein